MTIKHIFIKCKHALDEYKHTNYVCKHAIDKCITSFSPPRRERNNI